MVDKYFKPQSVTWWASIVPLILGLFLATADLHGLTALVAVVQEVTGGMGAYALINAGLAGIGLRGAVG